MAKSMRSKVKRSFRRAKRTDEKSVFAVADAARVHRLHAKLAAKIATDTEGDMKMANEEEETLDAVPPQPDASGDIPMEEVAKPAAKVSTHGRRESRKEQYKTAKGMSLVGKNRSKMLGEKRVKTRRR